MHQDVGRNQALLDHPQQVAAAARDRHALPLLRGRLQLAQRFVEALRIQIRESFHASTPNTLSRVIGRLLMRRSVALKKAFATAPTAGIMVGSPSVSAPNGP